MREFLEYTGVMTTLWPNLIIQQQSSTLAMRELVTRRPAELEATQRRTYSMKPANLGSQRLMLGK